MNTRHYLTTLRTIFLALAIGQMLFAAATYFFLADPYDTDMESAQPFIYVVPLVIAGALFGGFYLFTALVKTLRHSRDFSTRLKGYQTALLMRSLLAEGAVLFAIVVYLQTSYYLFIVLATLTMGYFVLLYPTVGKIAKDLALAPNERLLLENGEVV